MQDTQFKKKKTLKIYQILLEYDINFKFHMNIGCLIDISAPGVITDYVPLVSN